jgi:hypothetical protein
MLRAFSESEAAQIRMIVGAAAQRPMILTVLLADGQKSTHHITSRNHRAQVMD